MYGELIPQGGGDPIPLLKKQLLVGRRESCDIVLRFANVSAHHCQFYVNGGYWYVRDMQSRNGVKVNGIRRRREADRSWRQSLGLEAQLRTGVFASRPWGCWPSPSRRYSYRDHDRVTTVAGWSRFE